MVVFIFRVQELLLGLPCKLLAREYTLAISWLCMCVCICVCACVYMALCVSEKKTKERVCKISVAYLYEFLKMSRSI